MNCSTTKQKKATQESQRERERALSHPLNKINKYPSRRNHPFAPLILNRESNNQLKHQIIQGFPLLSHLILSLFPPKTVLKFRTSGLFQGGRKILKSFMGTNYFIFSCHNNSKDFKIKNHTSLATSTQSK